MRVAKKCTSWQLKLHCVTPLPSLKGCSVHGGVSTIAGCHSCFALFVGAAVEVTLQRLSWEVSLRDSKKCLFSQHYLLYPFALKISQPTDQIIPATMATCLILLKPSGNATRILRNHLIILIFKVLCSPFLIARFFQGKHIYIIIIININ